MTMNEEKIIDAFNDLDEFIITCHQNADGDAIGSSNALGLFLQKYGKNCKVIYPEEVPSKYTFLPKPNNAITFDEYAYENEIRTEGLIVLDSSDSGRVEAILKKIKYESLINIDHHPTNSFFGDLNLVEPEKSATCQVLFDLFDYFKENPGIEIDHDIAMNLYAGIMTDTGSFKFENTNSNTFEAASKLVSYGVLPHHVSGQIYESMPVKTFNLVRELINTLTLSEDKKIAWISCSKSLLDKYEVGPEELEGVINYPKSLEPVEFAVFFKETEEGYTKIGMRSKTMDVSKIALEFEGGGHKRAAGCFLKESLDKSRERIITRLKKEIHSEGKLIERDN